MASSRNEPYTYGRPQDVHNIVRGESECGNMGAQYSEFRAFCSCSWFSGTTQDHEVREQRVRDHLAERGAA